MLAFVWAWIAIALGAVAGWVVFGPNWLYGIMFPVALLNAFAWTVALRRFRNDEQAPGAGA